MIRRYLNSITKRTEFSVVSCRDEAVWSFSGDGGGDYEEGSDGTTAECLRDYILECEEQIARAKEYLAILESSPWNA